MFNLKWLCHETKTVLYKHLFVLRYWSFWVLSSTFFYKLVQYNFSEIVGLSLCNSPRNLFVLHPCKGKSYGSKTLRYMFVNFNFGISENFNKQLCAV